MVRRNFITFISTPLLIFFPDNPEKCTRKTTERAIAKRITFHAKRKNWQNKG